MILRGAGRLLAVALLLASVAGCGHASDEGGMPTPHYSGQPKSPVTGIVTSVDSSGLGQVHGFTLRDSTGHSYTFVIGQLENAAEFPPGHLAEHQLTAEPVEVWFTLDADLVVYRLADASPAGSPTPS